MPDIYQAKCCWNCKHLLIKDKEKDEFVCLVTNVCDEGYEEKVE